MLSGIMDGLPLGYLGYQIQIHSVKIKSSNAFRVTCVDVF